MNPPTPRTQTRTPRTGRRPGESSTRADILVAAEKLFIEQGYQGASMRAIAKEAGVDASLLVHFFGAKIELFAESVKWPFEPDDQMPKLLADGRSNVGRNLARLFVTTWDREGGGNPILTLLSTAASEPQAAEMMRKFTRERLFSPLLGALGSDSPELRANLLASQLVGVGMVRYVLEFEPIASAESDDVVAMIGPTLQRYLTGKLPA